MNILVACEESQRVCLAFRAKGHNAFSCDVQECSGGHPEWHIKGDVLNYLNPYYFSDLFSFGIPFCTQDGIYHEVLGKWDMIIAFPPCTYLTLAGNRHFSLKCSTVEKIAERKKNREFAADFFMNFVNADCDKIVIENPLGYMSSYFRKPDQIIHPYFFAESPLDKDNYVQKPTCLWLKGVPILKRKKNLEKPKPLYFCQGEKRKNKPIGWCEAISIKGGQLERAKIRSKTFNGVALAMADQWGNL